MSEPAQMIWPTFRYVDADAALTWLKAVGFTESFVARSSTDPSVIDHAQMLWPEGGGIMLGSVRDGTAWRQEPGKQALYVVTDRVDEVFERAVSAGGTVIESPQTQPYGGSSCAVADPEGNLWSFGSYRGE